MQAICETLLELGNEPKCTGIYIVSKSASSKVESTSYTNADSEMEPTLDFSSSPEVLVDELVEVYKFEVLDASGSHASHAEAIQVQKVKKVCHNLESCRAFPVVDVDDFPDFYVSPGGPQEETLEGDEPAEDPLAADRLHLARESPKIEPDGESPKTEPGGKSPNIEPDGESPKTEPDGKSPNIKPGGESPVIDLDGDSPKIKPGGESPMMDLGGDSPKIKSDADGESPVMDLDGDSPKIELDSSDSSDVELLAGPAESGVVYQRPQPPTYRCLLCSFRCGGERQLARHLRVRHGRRRLECARCGYQTFHGRLMSEHFLHRHRGAPDADLVCRPRPEPKQEVELGERVS